MLGNFYFVLFLYLHNIFLLLSGSLEKYVQKLDELFKTEILKNVYAGVNGKEADDPDMQAFFKFKCWI